MVMRFLDLSELRQHLAPFYSHTSRPWIDPGLMVRMSKQWDGRPHLTAASVCQSGSDAPLLLNSGTLWRPSRPYLSPHHCFSHGTPSPPPSIFTPGQLARKNSASSQEVICEQYTRPSH